MSTTEVCSPGAATSSMTERFKLQAACSRFYEGAAPPATSLSFDVLRVGTAMLLFVRLCVESPTLLDIYGDGGLVSWSLSEIRSIGWVPTLSWLAGPATQFDLDRDETLTVVAVIYMFAIIGMMLGLAARASTFATWFLHFLLLESSSLSSYGVDSFLNISLFYCMIVAHRDSANFSRTTGLVLRLLQFHLCLIYFTAGLEKAKGTEWWAGEAIWRSVMQPQFQTFDLSWLAWFPALAIIASWSTILIEMAYPLMIWSSRTRPTWLAATVALHLMIGLFLGLHFFAGTLIIMNVAAFGTKYLVHASEWMVGHRRIGWLISVPRLHVKVQYR